MLLVLATYAIKLFNLAIVPMGYICSRFITSTRSSTCFDQHAVIALHYKGVIMVHSISIGYNTGTRRINPCLQTFSREYPPSSHAISVCSSQIELGIQESFFLNTPKKSFYMYYMR